MRNNSRWICFSFALAALTLCQRTVRTQAAASGTGAATESTTVKVTFPNLLYSYGAKYSLYFTVERDEVDNNAGVKDASGKSKVSPLQLHAIELPPVLKDGDSFLAALGHALPDADILKDETVPGVVHIREKSLAKRSGYLLDKKVDFLFRGTAGDFLAEVRRESDWTFEEDNAFTVPGPQHYNTGLPSEVYAKGATFRTVLTMGLPRRSNPLLWTSYATEKEGRLVTVFKAMPSSPPTATATAPATTLALPANAVAEIDAAMRQRKQELQAIDQAAATIVGRPEVPVTHATPDDIASTDKITTVVVPLRNIPARTLLSDLQPMLAPQAVAGLLNSPNSLVISDTSEHLHQFVQLIISLDDAAGRRRAAAVARGADPRGLAWVQFVDTPPSGAATTPAASNPSDRYLAPVFAGADPTGVGATDMVMTQIVPLTFLSAASLATDLKSTLGPDAILAVSSTANCLILADKSPHIRQVLETIAKLDHPAPSTAPTTTPSPAQRPTNGP
jgi:hypothetical protein